MRIEHDYVNLATAVLEQAYKDSCCIIRYPLPSNKKYADIEHDNVIITDARRWLRSTDTKKMSFGWYCSCLDIDFDAIQKSISESINAIEDKEIAALDEAINKAYAFLKYKQTRITKLPKKYGGCYCELFDYLKERIRIRIKGIERLETRRKKRESISCRSHKRNIMG